MILLIGRHLIKQDVECIAYFLFITRCKPASHVASRMRKGTFAYRHTYTQNLRNINLLVASSISAYIRKMIIIVAACLHFSRSLVGK